MTLEATAVAEVMSETIPALEPIPEAMRRKRVLVFEAHGDDMEFAAGGTIAKFAGQAACATGMNG